LKEARLHLFLDQALSGDGGGEHGHALTCPKRATSAERDSKRQLPMIAGVASRPRRRQLDHRQCRVLAPSRLALRFSEFPYIKVLPIDLTRSSEPHSIATLKGRTLNPVAQVFIRARA